MTGINKNADRDTFHLKPLPRALAEEVLAKTQKLVEFLEQSGASTHPDVRLIVHACTLPMAGLIGQIETAKIQEAGGGTDEMDAWERNGITPVKWEAAPEVKRVHAVHGVDARIKELGLIIRTNDESR